MNILKNWIITFFFVLSLINTPTYAKPNILLKKIDGSTFNFSSLEGKWVFINYWASWCEPCVNEIAEFNKFYDKNSKNIAVFAVNYDSLSLSKQQMMADKFLIHYPSLQKESTAKLKLDDISVVPVTFVFDPKGQFATTLYGGQTLKDLTEIINVQEQPLKQHA